MLRSIAVGIADLSEVNRLAVKLQCSGNLAGDGENFNHWSPAWNRSERWKAPAGAPARRCEYCDCDCRNHASACNWKDSTALAGAANTSASGSAPANDIWVPERPGEKC